MYDFAVIGKGMIGSAAARYLSAQSDSVVLIGPDEPEGDWQEHEGVFASHYDQGRITRCMDGKLPWAIWATRSIAAYAEIEARSGINFYTQCGGVHVGFDNDDPDGSVNRTERVAKHLGTDYQKYSAETFRSLHPELAFDDGLVVLHESTLAGYINPRSLVAAQVTICEQQGADIVREMAVKIAESSAGVHITTGGGQTIQAKRVLVAAGAWTDFLTGADLGLIRKPRTIVLAKLDSAETERLKNMPTVIWYEGTNDPDTEGIYMLPPIEYPDGHTYIKLGGALHGLRPAESAAELDAWFKGDGSVREARGLETMLRRTVHGLRAESIHTNTCVVTNRVDSMPVIEPISDKVMVACAGNGSAAKSSNEIGRIAAIQLQRL